jgi:Xaa-Pro aminopeptidase
MAILPPARRRGRARVVLLGLLIGLAAGGCAQERALAAGAAADSTGFNAPDGDVRPLFTTHFPPEEFAARRAAVFDAIGERAFAILQGAAAPVGYVRFRQSNEFYHLTGIETPHAYLVLDGAARRTILYLPNRDERREYGEGKVLSAEDAELVRQLAGVDEVHSTDRILEHLRERARSGEVRTVYAPFSPAEGLATTRGMALRAAADVEADPLDRRVARHVAFLGTLRELLPGLALEDLTPTLDAIRLIKSPREIERIRASTKLHGLAILEAMRSTTPGITEYELEAIGKFVYTRHGAQGDAYYALAHIGDNAYMNHYHAGTRAARAGDMILLDYGTDHHYYVSDMARMWPADGRFNAVQRELYGFYLGFYEAILTRIRAGATPQQIKREALVEIDGILARTRFSKPVYRAAAEAFVEAYRQGAENPDGGLGHWVGMAAHDVGRDTGPLRPGMVLVIEPQFRVPEERIYVRLEDMILVTEDGAEILSDFVPRDMESIERLMREEGMLQRYPRLLTADGRAAGR